MTYLRDRVFENGTTTEYYIDPHEHKVHVKETTDVSRQIEQNKAEYDVDRRNSYGRDLEKMASVSGKALEAHAKSRGMSFQDLMRDKKELTKFVNNNPVWKTRPGKL